MRPKTLAAVADWTARGEPFDDCLAGFLDGFYGAPSGEALAEEPARLGPSRERGAVQDAYLAAVAEQLALAHRLPVPLWTAGEARALHRPWFSSSLASLRAVLLVESPAAFRSRNLFVSENALSRV